MTMTWDELKTSNVSAKSIAVEIDAVHRRTGTETTFYYSTDGFTTPAGIYYQDRLQSPITVSESIAVGESVGGKSEISIGEVRLLNVDGALDFWSDYAIDGREVRVKIAEVGTDISAYQVAVTAVGRRVVLSRDNVLLALSDKSVMFDRPVQERVYGGRGSALWFERSESDEVIFGAVGNFDTSSFNRGSVCGVEAWLLIPSKISGTETYYVCSAGNHSTEESLILLRVLVDHSADDVTVVVSRSENDSAGVSSTLSTAQLTDSLGLSYRDRLFHVSYDHFSGSRWVIDGKAVSEFSSFDSSAPGASIEVTRVFVGRSAESGDPNHFNGMIDDLRIWSRSRTVEERAASFRRPLDSTEGLAFYCKFDEDSGTSTLDEVTGFSASFPASPADPTWVSSLDGDSNVRGEPKRICLGHVFNAKPVLVGSSDLIYQVHDPQYFDGPTTLTAVYDNGVELTINTNSTSIKDFLTSSAPPAGTYNAFRPLGAVRLGASPNGQVTLDVRGPIGAEGGGKFATSFAKIARIIARQAGIDPYATEFDTASFDVLENEPSGGADVFLPPGGVIVRQEFGLGIFLSGEETVREALDKLAESTSAHWRFRSDNGKFSVQFVTLPSDSPALTVTVDDQTTEFDPMDTQVPVYRVVVGHTKNWNVQDADAVDVTDDRRSFLESEIRSVERVDNSVLDIHPSAIDQGLVGDLLSSEEGARIEARRRSKYYGRLPFMCSVTSPSLLFADIQVGNTVRVIHDRWDLDSGLDMLVINTFKSFGSPTSTQVSLWAPGPRVRYTPDGFRRKTRDGEVRIVR